MWIQGAKQKSHAEMTLLLLNVRNNYYHGDEYTVSLTKNKQKHLLIRLELVVNIPKVSESCFFSLSPFTCNGVHKVSLSILKTGPSIMLQC